MKGDPPAIPSGGRFDLRDARILCADETLSGQEVLSQILMGFGVQTVSRVETPEAFRKAMTDRSFDLVLMDSALGGNGYERVRWLRTSRLEPNRYTPAIVVAGHTPKSQVEIARDCGASFVVAKPISPAVLLQRILWIGRAGRLFVEAPNYTGPDRRFHHEGVPAGMKGRRKDDLSGQLGEAVDRNMSQDEIDGMMKPQRLAL